MKNYKLHISEGFKDTYGIEMLVKKEVENKLIKHFELFGCDLIKTPAVEYIDVYSQNGVQKPDLYNLINRQGEVLALCNDMTSSIARFVASNNIEGLSKFSYIADTFRYPRLYQGKKHQFLQAGVEFIGYDGIEADAECLYVAHQALKKCNINSFTIHIGSAKFLDVLFDDFNINSDVKNQINASIENKDYVTLNEILKKNLDSNKADLLLSLMLRGGHLKFINSLMNDLKNTKAYKELEYLKNLYTILNELGIENVIFDFSIYSYAKYYSGIIFSIYVDGIKKAVAFGGRCDNLFDSFNMSMKNIGFGLDVDSITEYLLENNLYELSLTKYLSYCADDSYIFAAKENEKLRDNNIVVNHVCYKDYASVLDYAKKYDYKKIIEYKNNKASIKEVE